MKKSIKLFFGTALTLLCMCTLFAMPTLAEEIIEIEVSKCSVTSPGPLCDAIIEVYGENSTAKYSLKDTVRCKYATSVTVDGEQVTVYMSEKPPVGNVDIYIDEDGKLVIDGTGNKVDEDEDENEIEDILSLDRLMMEYLRECIIYAYDVYDEEHYSKINDYLIGKMKGADIYYFMENELESVKLLFEDTVIKTPDEFIANHFFKSTLNINGETFVIYSDVEIPNDSDSNVEVPDESQDGIEVPDNSQDDMEVPNDSELEVSVSDPQEENNNDAMRNIIIASVGLLACVSIIIVFGVKSKTKKR